MNKNFFETSNFYNFPKTHKSKVREAAVYSQNTEVVKVRNLSNLKLIPIVGGPNWTTRRLLF